MMRKFQVSSLRTMNMLGGLMLALTGLQTGCPDAGTGTGSDCPSGKVRAADNSCVSATLCVKKNEQPAGDGSCVCETGFERVADACVAKCQTHATRSASGSCACDAGYVAEGATCVSPQSPPDMASTPPDMASMPPDMSPKYVDLQVENFSVYPKSTTSTYSICLDGISDFLDVKNIGNKDASAYKIGLGIYNVAEKGNEFLCAIPVSGTKAGQDTRYTAPGCCNVPTTAIKTGAHRIVVISDLDDETGDINVKNDFRYSDSFNLTGTRTLQAPKSTPQAVWTPGEKSSPPQADRESITMQSESANP